MIEIGKTTTWLKIQVVSFTRQPNWLTDWCPLRCTPRRCERWFSGPVRINEEIDTIGFDSFFFSSILCVYVCVCVCVVIFHKADFLFQTLPPMTERFDGKRTSILEEMRVIFAWLAPSPCVLLAGLSPPSRPGTTRLCWPGKRTSKRRPVWNTWWAPRWSLSTHTHTHSITSQIGKDNRNGKS